jgi:hypothetical protein
MWVHSILSEKLHVITNNNKFIDCGELVSNQVLLNQVNEMTKEIIREGSLKYPLIVNTGRQGFKDSLKRFDRYNHFMHHIQRRDMGFTK